MIYEFDWHTHNDPDELDYYLRDSMDKAGYDTPEFYTAEMDELMEAFGQPFYEITWRVRFNSENGRIDVLAINDVELQEPLNLKPGVEEQLDE